MRRSCEIYVTSFHGFFYAHFSFEDAQNDDDFDEK